MLARKLLVGTGHGTFDEPPVRISVNSTSVIDTGGALDWIGRASIKRRPSDDALVLVYRRGTSHAVNDGGLYIRFSDDHGATWTAENTTLGGGAVSGFPMNPTGKSAGEDAGEPWLYVADNGDLLLHMWRVDYNVSNNGAYQSRSTDGGETWSASAAIDFAAITGDSNIFSTDDDFVFGGTIYAGARSYSDAVYTQGSSILVISSDNGSSWSYRSTIFSPADSGNGAIEVGIEYVGNSTIIAMIRDTDHIASYKRISTDLGSTWGSVTNVTHDKVGIAGRQRVYTRAHLKGEASWWADPVLLMVGFIHMVPGDSNSRTNAVWVSRDAGASWRMFLIDAAYDDGGYGDMFYDPTADQYVVVSYRGEQGVGGYADLVQYRLDISGI